MIVPIVLILQEGLFNLNGLKMIVLFGKRIISGAFNWIGTKLKGCRITSNEFQIGRLGTEN